MILGEWTTLFETDERWESEGKMRSNILPPLEGELRGFRVWGGLVERGNGMILVWHGAGTGLTRVYCAASDAFSRPRVFVEVTCQQFGRA